MQAIFTVVTFKGFNTTWSSEFLLGFEYVLEFE